jgi:PAS domain S-box-containing protein
MVDVASNGRTAVRVVIGDDAPESRALLEAMLATRTGITIVGSASDGAEAVQLVVDHRPDLIFLDVAMPVMDGLEAASEIRARGDSTKVIVLSAYGADRMAAQALAAGADAYLEKSAATDELFSLIQRMFPDVPIETASRSTASSASFTGESAAEWRQRVLLDAVGEGVVVCSPTGHVMHANFAATQILAIPMSRIEGATLADLGLLTDANGLVAAAVASGRPCSDVPIDLRRRNGAPGRLLVGVRPLLVPGERAPREVIVSFVDVTAVAASEALLARAFEAVGVQLAYLDCDLNYVRVNGRYAAAHRLSPDAFVGRRYSELHPRADLAVLHRVVQTGEPLVDAERPSSHDHAFERGPTWWDMNVQPVRDPDGSVGGLLVGLADATERVLVRQQAAAREHRFRELVDLMAVPYLQFRAVREQGEIVDFRYEMVNKAAEKALGSPAADLVGNGLLELFPSHVELGLFDAYKRIIETGEPLHTEFDFDERGIRATFEITVSKVGDGLAIIGRDVTERVRDEQALRGSEERLRRALDAMLDSVVMAEAVRNEDGEIVDFRFTYMNPATVDVAGRRPRTGIGQLMSAASPGIRSSGLIEMGRRVVETGEAVVLDGVEFSDTRGGEQITGVYDLRASRVDDGLLLTYRNVAERHRTERALRETEQRFRVALQHSNMVVFHQDHDLRYTWAHNPLNFEPGELVGHTDEELIGAEQAAPLVVVKQQVLDTGVPVRTDVTLTGEAGPRVYDMHVEPLRDDKGEVVGITGVAVDITQRTLSSQALADAHLELASRNVALERSNRDLEQFAYVASHDLREPLRTIAGFASLLSGRYRDALDAAAIQQFDYMVGGVERMERLLDELLAVAVATGEPAAVGIADLNAVVRDVLAALDNAVRESGATVEVSDLPVLTGDPVQLGQLFQNLITNALRFVDEGVIPHVEITAEPDATSWCVVVADNGIGVPVDARQRIFHIFQRGRGLGRSDGTGIGLAICHRVVERHGGRIWVEDNPGGGSRFCIVLPR